MLLTARTFCYVWERSLSSCQNSFQSRIQSLDMRRTALAGVINCSGRDNQGSTSLTQRKSKHGNGKALISQRSLRRFKNAQIQFNDERSRSSRQRIGIGNIPWYMTMMLPAKPQTLLVLQYQGAVCSWIYFTANSQNRSLVRGSRTFTRSVDKPSAAESGVRMWIGS